MNHGSATSIETAGTRSGSITDCTAGSAVAAPVPEVEPEVELEPVLELLPVEPVPDEPEDEELDVPGVVCDGEPAETALQPPPGLTP